MVVARAPRDAQPDLVRLGSPRTVCFGAVQGFHADELYPQVVVAVATQFQPAAHDLACKPRAGDGVDAGVRHLSLADEVLEIADADLQSIGPRLRAGAGDLDEIGANLLELEPGDVQD